MNAEKRRNVKVSSVEGYWKSWETLAEISDIGKSVVDRFHEIFAENNLAVITHKGSSSIDYGLP